MISAINSVQRQIIQPRIQKQQNINQIQINSANASFTGKPNWQAAGVMGVISAAAIIGGVLELTDIIANTQTIKASDVMHFFEALMGLGLGGGGGFATFRAITNEPPKIKFLSDCYFKK